MGTKDIDIIESSDKSMYMMSVNVYNVCNKIISPEADIKSTNILPAFSFQGMH